MATQPVTSIHDRFVAICIILFCILLGSFVAVMVCGNPGWAFYLFGENKKFEILKFLGVGMGGVLLTLQVLMSHKRQRYARAGKSQPEHRAGAEAGTPEKCH